MDNSKHKSYQHICHYLFYLWDVEKLSGIQILERTEEMHKWLFANCIENGECTFIWDNHYTKYPANVNKDYCGISIFGRSSHEISLSNSVAFKYEQDLLAFRLRWGIQA